MLHYTLSATHIAAMQPLDTILLSRPYPGAFGAGGMASLS